MCKSNGKQTVTEESKKQTYSTAQEPNEVKEWKKEDERKSIIDSFAHSGNN